MSTEQDTSSPSRPDAWRVMAAAGSSRYRALIGACTAFRSSRSISGPLTGGGPTSGARTRPPGPTRDPRGPGPGQTGRVRTRDLNQGLALILIVVVGVLGIAALLHTPGPTVAVPYRPPPGPATGPPPAPNAVWRKTGGREAGPLGLDGGRTGTNDRELVLRSGGPPAREVSPESGCGQDIVPVVVEDSPTRIVLQGRAVAATAEQRRALGNVTLGCVAMWFPRTTFVQLPGPLGDRAVYDAQDLEHALTIVDGATLLVPGWLPAGYQLVGESDGAVTTFTYRTTSVGPAGAEGGVDVPGLSISQGTGPAILPTPAPGTEATTTEGTFEALGTAGRVVTLRGRRAALVRRVSFLPVSLVWEEDGRWVTITYRPPPEDPSAGGPSDADLVRVAESLHPVGH